MSEVQKCGLDGQHDDSDIRIETPAGGLQPGTPVLRGWQRSLRLGIFPQIALPGLLALRSALERDDPRVITGRTCVPPALQFVLCEPVQAACPTCWLILAGRMPHEITVGQLEELFWRTCVRAGELLGEPSGARHILNHLDEISREQLKAELLAEIDIELASREGEALKASILKLAAAIEKVASTQDTAAAAFVHEAAGATCK